MRMRIQIIAIVLLCLGWADGLVVNADANRNARGNRLVLRARRQLKSSKSLSHDGYDSFYPHDEDIVVIPKSTKATKSSSTKSSRGPAVSHAPGKRTSTKSPKSTKGPSVKSTKGPKSSSSKQYQKRSKTDKSHRSSDKLTKYSTLAPSMEHGNNETDVVDTVDGSDLVTRTSPAPVESVQESAPEPTPTVAPAVPTTTTTTTSPDGSTASTDSPSTQAPSSSPTVLNATYSPTALRFNVTNAPTLAPSQNETTEAPTSGPTESFVPSSQSPVQVEVAPLKGQDEANNELDLAVVSSPFALHYTINGWTLGADIADAEYQQVVQVTRAFLKTYLVHVYGLTSDIVLKDVETMATDRGIAYSSESATELPTVDYEVTAIFDAMSTPLPDVEQVDSVLTLAFAGDSATEYIHLLQQDLDLEVFRATTGVSLSWITPQPILESTEGPARSSSTSSTSAIVGASAGAMVLVGALVYLRRSRQRHQNDDKQGNEGREDETITFYKEDHKKSTHSWTMPDEEEITAKITAYSSSSSEEGSPRQSYNDFCAAPIVGSAASDGLLLPGNDLEDVSLNSTDESLLEDFDDADLGSIDTERLQLEREWKLLERKRKRTAKSLRRMQLEEAQSKLASAKAGLAAWEEAGSPQDPNDLVQASSQENNPSAPVDFEAMLQRERELRMEQEQKLNEAYGLLRAHLESEESSSAETVETRNVESSRSRLRRSRRSNRPATDEESYETAIYEEQRRLAQLEHERTQAEARIKDRRRRVAERRRQLEESSAASSSYPSSDDVSDVTEFTRYRYHH